MRCCLPNPLHSCAHIGDSVSVRVSREEVDNITILQPGADKACWTDVGNAEKGCDVGMFETSPCRGLIAECLVSGEPTGHGRVPVCTALFVPPPGRAR